MVHPFMSFRPLFIIAVLLHCDIRVALVLLVSSSFLSSTFRRTGISHDLIGSGSWLGRKAGASSGSWRGRVEDALLKFGLLDICSSRRIRHLESTIKLGDEMRLGFGILYFLERTSVSRGFVKGNQGSIYEWSAEESLAIKRPHSLCGRLHVSKYNVSLAAHVHCS